MSLQKIEKLKPFKHFCMSIGELPSSYMESMTYLELLMWLCKYLSETVIPAINNNAQAVEELQGLFIQLQNFVDNYFDNLDVQEEINHKLDEMVEDGTIENILYNYSNITRIYNTTEEMIEDSDNLKNGMKVKTLGYRNVNDNGGAYFFITNQSNVNKYQIDFENGLYATLITNDNSINIKQLGAYGDNVHNDTQYFKLFATSPIKTLIIPDGHYKINDTIDFVNKSLIGIDKPTIEIYGITTDREHTLHGSGIINISNIKFLQSVALTNIIGFFNAHDSIINNCDFIVDGVRCNGYVDFYTDNHNMRVENCYFDCVSIETVDYEVVNAIGGVWVRQYDNDHTTDNIIFEKCTFKHRSKDEAIAIWNNRTPNLLSNIRLNNSIIQANEKASCPHLISLNANNSSINNCIIERKSNTIEQCSSIIAGQQHTAISYINDCKINTNLKCASGLIYGSNLIANNCIINDESKECRLINTGSILKNSIINCVSLQCQYNNIIIEDCTFNISAQTHSWCFRNTIELRNNVFNFATTTPTNLIYALSDDNIYKIYNNVFNSIVENRPTLINFSSHTGCKLFAYNNINMGQINGTEDIDGVVSNNNTLVTLNTFTSLKQNNNFNINGL